MHRIGNIGHGTAIGLLPNNIALGVKLQNPDITITSPKRISAPNHQIPAIVGLPDRISPVFFIPAIGLLPNNIALGVKLQNPDITITSPKRISFPRHHVATVCRLLHIKSVIPIISAIGLLPNNIALGVKLQNPDITITSPKRMGPTDHNVTTIGSLANFVAPIFSIAAIGFLPGNITI